MDQLEKEQLHKVLKMSLYDILNELCSQMMKKGVNEDWIGFNAINGIDHRKYQLILSLKVIEEE